MKKSCLLTVSPSLALWDINYRKCKKHYGTVLTAGLPKARIEMEVAIHFLLVIGLCSAEALAAPKNVLFLVADGRRMWCLVISGLAALLRRAGAFFFWHFVMPRHELRASFLPGKREGDEE